MTGIEKLMRGLRRGKEGACLTALAALVLMAGTPVTAQLVAESNLLASGSLARDLLDITSPSEAAGYLWDGLQQGPAPLVPPGVPEFIVQCNSTDDAATAVRWARSLGLKLYARGNGHHFAGVCLANGGVTADLSGLRAISVDEAAGVVKIQPGVTAGQLLRQLTPRGLFTSVPNLDNVGMSGYVLGGGIGDNSKVIGFGCDNAVAFEVVDSRTDAGNIITVDAGHEPELFWGLRGAGANLALVTSITLRLHPYIPQLTSVRAPFPLEEALPVLQFWRTYEPALPPNHFSQVSFGFNPRLGNLTVSLVEQVWVSNTSAATEDPSSAALEQVAAFAEANGALAPAEPMPLSYDALRQAVLPPNTALYSADAIVNDLSDEVLEIVAEIGSSMTSRMSIVGLARASDAEATSFNASESAIGFRGKHIVTIWAIWQRTPAGAAADGDATHIGWARNALAQLRPHVVGRYPNTVMYENANDTQLCYEPGAWERLQRVKRAYDPSNLFRELDYYKADLGRSAADAARDAAVTPVPPGGP